MQELLQWSNMGRKIFDPAMDTSRPTWRVARLWQGRGFAFAHCCGIEGCKIPERGCRLKKGLLIPIVARFWSAGEKKKTRRKWRVLIRMCRSSSSYATTTRVPTSSSSVQELLPATTWNAQTHQDSKQFEGLPRTRIRTLPRISQAEHGTLGSSSSKSRWQICVSLPQRKPRGSPQEHPTARRHRRRHLPASVGNFHPSKSLPRTTIATPLSVKLLLSRFPLSDTSSLALRVSWRLPWPQTTQQRRAKTERRDLGSYRFPEAAAARKNRRKRRMRTTTIMPIKTRHKSSLSLSLSRSKPW